MPRRRLISMRSYQLDLPFPLLTVMMQFHANGMLLTNLSSDTGMETKAEMCSHHEFVPWIGVWRHAMVECNIYDQKASHDKHPRAFNHT